MSIHTSYHSYSSSNNFSNSMTSSHTSHSSGGSFGGSSGFFMSDYSRLMSMDEDRLRADDRRDETLFSAFDHNEELMTANIEDARLEFIDPDNPEPLRFIPPFLNSNHKGEDNG